LSCRLVVDHPETYDKRRCSCSQKTSREPEKFIAAQNIAHTGFAGTQSGDLRSKIEVEDVEQVKPVVAKANGREISIIGAKDAVGGDVNPSGCWAILAKLVYPRLRADKDIRIGQQPLKRVYFFVDMRSQAVRYGQDEVSSRSIRSGAAAADSKY